MIVLIAMSIAALVLSLTGLPLNGYEFFGILLLVGLATHFSRKRRITNKP